MTDSTHQAMFRKAVPPENERARWRGFQPGSTTLKSGTYQQTGGRPLTCDIILDRDVEVVLRDGTVIYIDVYRPTSQEKIPAIVVLGPYGKQGGYWNYDIFNGNAGVPHEAVSGLQKFEGPDPALFCAHGYAVVHVDARGSFASNGDINMFSPQENLDNYDTIESVAAFEWCNGRVVTSGNSWLAVTQWMVATIKPPHLVAIAPWEGYTDIYRDMVCRGGIPAPDFSNTVVVNNFGRNGVEDIPAALEAYPLINDYWRSKQVDASLIDVPAYVVASYTNTLHVRGTLDAFSRLKKDKSWLRIHNTHEWQDLYAYEQDLLKFFDAVVKNKANGWTEVPRVRLSVLDPGGVDTVDRAEESWPLERAQSRAFYLDAERGELSVQPQLKDAATIYDAKTGRATFTFKADEDFEIVGSSCLQIWVSTAGSNDVDLYAFIQKLDVEGNVQLSETLPGTRVPVATGQLRASHRELDASASSELVPVHSHLREQMLEDSVPVKLDIGLWPAGIRFRAGERLQLVVAGHDGRERYLGQAETTTRNRGTHTIHSGGDFESKLLLPIVKEVSSG